MGDDPKEDWKTNAKTVSGEGKVTEGGSTVRKGANSCNGLAVNPGGPNVVSSGGREGTDYGGVDKEGAAWGGRRPLY